jgi:hypothetical protein
MIVNNDTNAMSIGANIDYELDQTLAATFQRQLVGLKSFDDAGDDDAEDDGGDAARAPGQVGSVRLTDSQIVRPGDLITADFVNKLLGRLARLEAIIGLGGAAERGTFAMPYFFGVGLNTALEEVRSRGLRLRKILDLFGLVHADSAVQAVDIQDLLDRTRLFAGTQNGIMPVILGQYPAPQARVKRGENVSLLIILTPLPSPLSVRGATAFNAAPAASAEGAAGTMNSFDKAAASSGATKTTKKRASKKTVAGKNANTQPDIPT